MDLTSLHSIHTTMQLFTSRTIHILLCNASIMAVPPGLTTDGYEIQFGVNHLAHALITKLLLPTLLHTAASEPVRIITVLSLGYTLAPSSYSRHKDTSSRRITLLPQPF
ncbi:hypothetical protein ACMFMG_010166 [Clarireedia jacksonii]